MVLLLFKYDRFWQRYEQICFCQVLVDIIGDCWLFQRSDKQLERTTAFFVSWGVDWYNKTSLKSYRVSSCGECLDHEKDWTSWSYVSEGCTWRLMGHVTGVCRCMWVDSEVVWITGLVHVEQVEHVSSRWLQLEDHDRRPCIAGKSKILVPLETAELMEQNGVAYIVLATVYLILEPPSRTTLSTTITWLCNHQLWLLLRHPSLGRTFDIIKDHLLQRLSGPPCRVG